MPTPLKAGFQQPFLQKHCGYVPFDLEQHDPGEFARQSKRRKVRNDSEYSVLDNISCDLCAAAGRTCAVRDPLENKPALPGLLFFAKCYHCREASCCSLVGRGFIIHNRQLASSPFFLPIKSKKRAKGCRRRWASGSVLNDPQREARLHPICDPSIFLFEGAKKYTLAEDGIDDDEDAEDADSSLTDSSSDTDASSTTVTESSSAPPAGSTLDARRARAAVLEVIEIRAMAAQAAQTPDPTMFTSSTLAERLRFEHTRRAHRLADLEAHRVMQDQQYQQSHDALAAITAELEIARDRRAVHIDLLKQAQEALAREEENVEAVGRRFDQEVERATAIVQEVQMKAKEEAATRKALKGSGEMMKCMATFSPRWAESS